MKRKKIILTTLAIMVFAISAFSIDLNSTVDTNKTNISILNDDDNFEKRFVYFDRSLADDENFELIKKVIIDAKRLGFNGIVVEQEWIYTRLSHNNPIINKIKGYISEIERLAHLNDLELVAMHFRANVANEVVHDDDPDNPFFKDGNFSFSEANKATTIYEVNGSIASPNATPQVRKPSLLNFDDMYDFDNIKLNTEYKITLDATTDNYLGREIKVSVLDGDYNGENGKVIYGVHKYFKDIAPSKKHGKYEVYFNSLDHAQRDGKIKVYVEDKSGVTIHSVSVVEVGYTPAIHVKREENIPIVTDLNETTLYQEGVDYNLMDNGLNLLSQDIKKEKLLKVIWYPEVATSLPDDQLTFSDICADEELYYKIILDQARRIDDSFNNSVDSYAVDDDEWRSAGWDEKCIELYAKEFQAVKDGNFTGADYIGISTKRLIEKISQDQNRSDLTFYLMSDMFDPNFNAKTPYMGVKKSADGAYKYLPKDQVVVFNWFANPYEPGLEDKTKEDFLKSAKHFADQGIRQIIAGYHDDMRNLDANFAFYNDSDEDTKKSIIGFMYLIWFQNGKTATYDDMEPVVKRICEELPGKWPLDVCESLKE